MKFSKNLISIYKVAISKVSLSNMYLESLNQEIKIEKSLCKFEE